MRTKKRFYDIFSLSRKINQNKMPILAIQTKMAATIWGLAAKIKMADGDGKIYSLAGVS